MRSAAPSTAPSFADAVDDLIAESTPLFNPGAAQAQARASRRTLVLRGLLYALQTFYAFMLMYVSPSNVGYELHAKDTHVRLVGGGKD